MSNTRDLIGLFNTYIKEYNVDVDWYKVARNHIYKHIIIDERFIRYGNIKYISTPLYSFQLSIINIVINWLNGKCIKYQLKSKKINIRSNAILLNSCYGSGKTLVVLSIITLIKENNLLNGSSRCNIFSKESLDRYNYDGSIYIPSHVITSSDISIKAKCNKVFPCIIVVGGNMLLQWRNELKKHVKNNYINPLYIKGLQDIYKLYLLIETDFDKLLAYDVIIVRNCRVFDKNKYYVDLMNDKFGFLDPIYTESGSVSASTLLSSLLCNVVFKIAIYDDYDMIGTDFRIFNACKHIFVSGSIVPMEIPYTALLHGKAYYSNITKKKEHKPEGKFNISYDGKISTLEKYVLFNNNNMDNLTNNPCIRNAYNLTPSADYVSNSVSIDIPSWRKTIVYNASDVYADIMNELMVDDSNKDTIVNAIHAGDYTVISKEFNVMNNNIHDVVHKLLGTNMDAYIKNITDIDYLTNVLDVWDEIPFNRDNLYTKEDILDGAQIENRYDGLWKIVTDTLNHIKNNNNKLTIKLDNIRDTFQKQVCQLCYSDDSTDKAVFTCNNSGYEQSIITCINCIGEYTRGSVVGTKFTAKCIICSKHNVGLSDFLFISKDVDLDAIVNTDVDKILDSVDEHIDVLNWKQYIRFNKEDAVMDILNGNIPVKSYNVNVNLTNIMKGNTVLPNAPYRKVIIVTSNNVLCYKLFSLLTSKGLNPVILDGDYEKINSIVEDFNMVQDFDEVTSDNKYYIGNAYGNSDMDRILIINTTEYAAGLNLQTATDMIICHHLLNISEESQVVGRIIRSGMLYHTNIWYILGISENDKCSHITVDTANEIDNVECAEALHAFKS